ncbi:MAG: DUF58 domain-containing protein [Acidobacteria bacterium]|nr:MAG: DUF58 domain-containing protein [Acidobacteriota bacterium]
MKSVLDPAVVAAIDDLEVVARYIVEGLRTGEHRSPFHGFSAEFSQYRPYRPGDDLKYLDWKVLARTDRLYTRQFRETTNLSAMLVLDASASMAYPADGVSKFKYARMLTAALAYLLVQQGDAVGLMTTDHGRLLYLPPRGGKMHLRRVLAQLSKLTPSGTWSPGAVIARAAELLRRRGVLLVLSDFYDDDAATLTELKRASRRGHEAGILQVMSKPEIEFPYSGGTEFEDLESSARRVVDAAGIARGYRARVGEFLERWRADARGSAIDYALMTTDRPPDEALRGYLIRRGAGRDVTPLAGAHH